MKKIRAVYIGDVRFNSCPVFELNEEGDFQMLEDNEFKYSKVAVEEDADWLIFEVNTKEDRAKLLNF